MTPRIRAFFTKASKVIATLSDYGVPFSLMVLSEHIDDSTMATMAVFAGLFSWLALMGKNHRLTTKNRYLRVELSLARIKRGVKYA